MDKEKTKVVFRKFNDGDIIALFFEISADIYGRFCQSYMHVGQHGGADAKGLFNNTKLAKPNEYESLKKELEEIVGYNLDICNRIQWKNYCRYNL